MSRRRNIEAIESSEYVTIGELVRLTGMRYSTLKFYTEEGLISFSQAEQNLTRRFKREETLLRLQSIKELKNDGKSIPQIKDILLLNNQV